jgi:hypothetical protein
MRICIIYPKLLFLKKVAQIVSNLCNAVIILRGAFTKSRSGVYSFLEIFVRVYIGNDKGNMMLLLSVYSGKKFYLLSPKCHCAPEALFYVKGR